MALSFNMFLIISFICAFNTAEKKAKWKLRKQEDGIRVYTRQTIGSDFKSFRATTTIDAEPKAIMAVLLNLNKVPEWTPDITHARLLREIEEGKEIVYMQYNLPWPINDRDVVFEQQFKREADTLWLCSEYKAGYLPEKQDYTRVEALKGFWKLVDTGSSTHTIYQLHSNPGGKLPAWLVNWKIINAPYKTLHNLRNRVED
ncbi:MAG: hypothetical protein K9I94_01370 [Bacteroidales bacterium]|nr:hypothetical protein [Bacteroidales bacterium]